jgi:hypothetical protein
MCTKFIEKKPGRVAQCQATMPRPFANNAQLEDLRVSDEIEFWQPRGNPGYRTFWRLCRPHSTSDVGAAGPFHVESGNRSVRCRFSRLRREVDRGLCDQERVR